MKAIRYFLGVGFYLLTLVMSVLLLASAYQVFQDLTGQKAAGEFGGAAGVFALFCYALLTYGFYRAGKMLCSTKDLGVKKDLSKIANNVLNGRD